MSTHILRPSTRILSIGAPGLRIVQPGGGAVVDWSQWFDHLWIAKGAASLDASYTDHVGTQTLGVGVAPTLSADGWVFAGAGYLTCENPAASNWSYMMRVSGVSIGYMVGFGVGVPVRIYRIYNRGYFSNYASSPERAFSGTGNVAMSDRSCYVDDVLVATLAAASGTNLGGNMFIGAYNQWGAPSDYLTGTICAFGIKHGPLTTEQLTAAYTAMAAL